MLKILFIILIIGYVLFKGLGLVMRMLFGVSQKGQSRQFNRSYTNKQPTSGNVDVNHDPTTKSKKGKESFRGGEYVDFEEVD